jgi:hypothetical protein
MSNPVYELRQYRTFPGRRDDLVRIMDEEVIPFQRECGLDVVGTFIAADDPDLYVWIRRFDDIESRDRITKAIYESERWKREFDGPIREMIDYSRVRVTTLHEAQAKVS